jgi:serine/threonine-protein kinase
MLTGTVPFRGATPVAIAYRHVREDPAAPRLLNPDIPPALEAVCLKAMAKRPEDRYQTAAELRADLQRARAGQRVAAGPAAGPATAAMATTVLPPLGGYPGAPDPTAAFGGPVAPSRAARHAEPPPGPRRRWWLYVLVPLGVLALGVGVAFVVSRLVGGLPETPSAQTLPTATAASTVPTTLLPTSTSQPPTTSRPPTTTAPPTTAPTTTTQQQPGQVQVPDVIGRRARVARAQLQAAGLQVNQQQLPVRDPQQAGRVVLQNPQAGTTVGSGSTVTIVVGVRFGDGGGDG